jgi:hypothetical protein
MSDLSGDDLQWRRPPAGASTPTPGNAPATPVQSGPPTYSGPPRTIPPPAGWRPRLVVQPQPPRKLPPQDLATLDAQEREARTITYGIGMIAGAVLLVVLLILCGRVIS